MTEEQQLIELTVENAQNRLRIHALEQILALFFHHKTDKQQQALQHYYEYISNNVNERRYLPSFVLRRKNFPLA